MVDQVTFESFLKAIKFVITFHLMPIFITPFVHERHHGFELLR